MSKEPESATNQRRNDGDKSSLPIPYAPSPARRWYRALRRLALLGGFVGLIVLGWSHWNDLERRADILLAQRACMNYSAPPTVAAYDETVSQRQVLLGSGQGYRPILLGVGIVPAPWKRLQPYVPDTGPGPVLFLGRRTSSAGHERLILVDLASFGEVYSSRRLVLLGNLYEPGSLGSLPKVLSPRRDRTAAYEDGFYALTLQLDSLETVKFCAGQPDPGDPSHFTISYAKNGQAGRIDGWLKDDDVVVLKPSGG